MGKILTTVIDKFGSMTPNIREKSYNFALSCHFDIFKNSRLSPNRKYTLFTDSSEKVVKFLYTKRYDSGVVYRIWGLGGVTPATGEPKIFYSNYVNSIASANWETSSLVGGTGTKADEVFFEYKDYVYFWQNGQVLSQLGPMSGSAVVIDSFQAITYTNVAQPVHHKADDYAYFFQDNKVHKFTGASSSTVWSSNVLTLPDNMKIIGGASYGNYLAIVCSPIEPGTTNSVMYLWDRDSSLSTLTAKIDLGMAQVIHVSEAEDGGIYLTQIVETTQNLGNYNNSLVVKYYNGYFETVEVPFGGESEYFSNITLSGNSQEARNIFYFPGKIVTDLAAETRHVIFAAKRNGGKLDLTIDQEITGVTQNINGIFFLNGSWLVSYDTVAKTAVTADATITDRYQTARYESLIFNDGDSSVTKKLLGVTVSHLPILISGSVILEYRKDEETAWTTIFTNSTVGSISHSAINVESSAANLPQYKEIQFRISSTGGSEITGFKFKSEIIDKDLY
jgi:hypothetical protein